MHVNIKQNLSHVISVDTNQIWMNTLRPFIELLVYLIDKNSLRHIDKPQLSKEMKLQVKDIHYKSNLTLFSTAFWPTYLARAGIFTPLGIFDFRAQKSGFKGKAVYHPKI